MDRNDGYDERADLVSAKFAQLTARYEDAAGIAGDAQARLPSTALLASADTLQVLHAEAGTLLTAICDLLQLDRATPQDVDDE